MYQIHNWMIDSVHYLSENNNRITVNTILFYILKRRRLTPKMTTTTDCHVTCKRESFKWPEYLPLYENTPISFIIIHDGIKDVIVYLKIGIMESKNESIIRQCSWHKTRLTLQTMQYTSISFKVIKICTFQHMEWGGGSGDIALITCLRWAMWPMDLLFLKKDFLFMNSESY